MKTTLLAVKLFLAFSILLVFEKAFSQTNTFPTTGAAGIGTVAPNSSSLLDVSSTSKGVLIPRMTKTQRDAINDPALGLLIYQSNNTAGFYYYDGSAWTALSPKYANKSLNNLVTPTLIDVDLQPATDNTVNLGSSSFSWKDLFADGISYITTPKIGNFTGTGQAGMLRWTGTEFQGYNGTSWLAFTGSGGSGANTSLSNLAATAVNVNLLPLSNNSIDIGSSALSWKSAYFDGDIYLDDLKCISYSNSNLLIGNTQNTSVNGGSNIFIGDAAGKNCDSTSNTFVGNSAGRENVLGNSNSFFGVSAGQQGTRGSANCYFGKAAGYDSDTASYNSCFGNLTGLENIGSFVSLFGNQAGSNNKADYSCFFGSAAGLSNTTGSENSFFGHNSAQKNTTGSYNTYFGSTTGFWNITGSYNSFFGYHAGEYSTGGFNSYFGYNSGTNNTTGTSNAFFGYNAGSTNTSGGDNTIIGAGAGGGTTGNDNISIGARAGVGITTGFRNVIIGTDAGNSGSDGSFNVVIGVESGYSAVGTDRFTAVGTFAGNSHTDYTDCTFLGYSTDATSNLITNSIALGSGVQVSQSNAIVIGNGLLTKIGIGKNTSASNIMDFAATTARLTTGGVWTNASDPKLKNNVQQLEKRDILDRVNQLKIQRWHYIADEEPITHIGPMSDQFYELFKTGDDSTISTIDPGGVALLAIQALSSENENLKTENEKLSSMLESLNLKVDQLAVMLKDPSSANGFVKLELSNPHSQTILGQNIPNPFDNSTLIPFRIPKDCNDASIMITNTSTSEVISVIPISCNEDHLRIDAGNLASGVYSYTLYVDGKLVDTKQMVIQK